jgi:hypothetical protein
VALPPCGRYIYSPLHIISLDITPVISLVWGDQFQSRAGENLQPPCDLPAVRLYGCADATSLLERLEDSPGTQIPSV